jgi:hypothetical protein
VTVDPHDLFDRLLAIDWSQRFESFDEAELQQLRLYDKLAQDLGRSSFFAAPLTFSVKASPEESYQHLEHAGHDALRSMMMTFRQLWSAKEPARFDATRALLRRHALPARDGVDAVELLDEVGTRFKQATSEVMMKNVWKDDPVGEPINVIRARQVIDDWFYAGAFHTDEEKAGRVRRWSPKTYEFTLAKAIHDVAYVMWELQVVVGGVLSAAEQLLASGL